MNTGCLNGRDAASHRKKQVARESLCALLCEDASLQKSSSLKIAHAVDVDPAAKKILLSLVRGEPPACMPSYSVSKSAFLPAEEWLEGATAFRAIDAQMGANTLRECLQGPESWERARIIALRALIMTARAEPLAFEELLPHLVVGVKADADKQLTHCRETVAALAVAFVEALPNDDNFEFAVLQLVLANEEVKIPALRAVITRSTADLSLLIRARNLMQRLLDTDATTPVFDALEDATPSAALGVLAMVHLCDLNVQCLTRTATRALAVIHGHVARTPRLCLLMFMLVAVRLMEVRSIPDRRRCLAFLQAKMQANAAGGYAQELGEAVVRHPHVLRVVLDGLVACAFHANTEAEPVYEIVLALSTLLQLQLRATAAAAANAKLPALGMDIAGLLKIRALALHLTHCGIVFEHDKRLEPLVTSLMDSLTDDALAKYAAQFEIDHSLELEDAHIWADISELADDEHGLGLFVAAKRRVQAASDVVWAFNSVQRAYVGMSILGNYEMATSVPKIQGFAILNREKWCLRDALKVALATLTANVTLHAAAMASIAAVAARNNERALFFVSALVDSTIRMAHLCCGSEACESLMQMIEMNVTMLARLARHRLALPIVYSAFRYIFAQPVVRRCREVVPGFYHLESRWRCLMLRHSDVPSAKVIEAPAVDTIAAMSMQERDVYMAVFCSLCKYRPDDAVKHVNEVGTLFAEFPVQAIDSCARMCKNDVMDFGVAFRVHVEPLFQAHVANVAVVGAVGSFFCDYLEFVSVRIQGQVSDEDVLDLNVILPTLLKLTALNDLNGVTAVAALLKSPLWAKLAGLRKWHVNKECDCHSLLDRIKKQQLQCTYAKLDPSFFEFDFSAFINNVDSADDDGRDVSLTHGQSLLISSVLDAESDSTSRADLISRRNEAVVGFNREIRKATREIMKLLDASSASVYAFRWFLEDEDLGVPLGGGTNGVGGGNKALNGAGGGAAAGHSAGVVVGGSSLGVPMQGAVMGLGGLRCLHLMSLFKLYGVRVSGRKLNWATVCENAYNGIVTGGASITGRFIADVALLANVPESEHSNALVKYMLIYLKDMGDTISTLKCDVNRLGCHKATVFALALSYMHCRYCVVTEFPLVVFALLRPALARFNVCADLVETLYLVLGNIYRYTNLHFDLTEEVVQLFSEYLEVVHDSQLGLGWVLGLTNLIEDIPRACMSMIAMLVNRLMALLDAPEVSNNRRALLTMPLLQYWGLNKCEVVAAAIAQQLLELERSAATDPCAMLLVAYCHYMDFRVHIDLKELNGARANNGSGGIVVGGGGGGGGTCGTQNVVIRIDQLEGNIACMEKRNSGAFCMGNSAAESVGGRCAAVGGKSTGSSAQTHSKGNRHKPDGGAGKIPEQLQEKLMACIRHHANGKDEDKDILIVAAMLAHRCAYMVPPRTACAKQLLRHKNGWYPLFKDFMDAMSAISRKDGVRVSMAPAARGSRYSRGRGGASTAAGHSAAMAVNGSGAQKDGGSSNRWGDESAALTAILQLEQIKRFLAEHSDLDCYRETGSIAFLMDSLRKNRHSFKLLSALTLCKPLRLALWDVVSFEETECNCERELVLRIYCLHGQTNRPLLERMAAAAKYFGAFDRSLKLSFLNCVKLAFWSIDFNSLRMVLSYIADFEDSDVLLTIDTLLDACVYLLKGSDGAGANGEPFAQQVLSKLLHPVVVQVVSRSRLYKAALCLYRKIIPHLNDEQRRELALAVNTSDIAFKCVLCSLSAEGEAPLSFNECFAHLATQDVAVRDIVLYCYVNMHRHLEVMLHCTHVLNVHANTEQITLVALALMALVAERNVAQYLVELAFDGLCTRATARHELLHVADLDIYEFLRMSREPNLFYYDTIDAHTLAKSANVQAPAPGMWKNCGLEATALGSLMPMARGRRVPSWLPKLGNIALDRRRQSLLPMEMPERRFQSAATDVVAEHLLVDSTAVIMAAYKAHLVEHHAAHPGIRDVIAFINARVL